jgi:hypothetical protein
MPGYDGSGPQGMGPMTGGRRGYCSGNIGQEQMYYGGFRRGGRFGAGYGGGRMRGGFGRRGMFQAPISYGQPAQVYSKEDELNMLRNDALDLKATLRDVETRIAGLESKNQPDD